MIKIPSFKVFGIDVAGRQTRPVTCDKHNLRECQDEFLNNKVIKKVVVIKEWV